MAVQPGDVLRDRYRIDALIGRGGMGHVFAATAIQTQARVAIKVVSRLLVDDVLMVRLQREAEAARRIQSEYVPHVYEVSDTDEGETFLVMERLVGEPLSQRIRDRGALPWSEVRRIGEDVLQGLIDAHAAGVVHRDLKPSNVFLTLKEDRVRAMVLDFGVCKMATVDAERLTATGESIGTVAYMAPEQIRGAARVDERADLFAFGALVFEMLTGRLPHEGPSQMAILASKLENAPARVREFTRVAIPQGTDELVARALERDPNARHQNARDLLEAWRGLPAECLVPPAAAAGAQTGENPATPISVPSGQGFRRRQSGGTVRIGNELPTQTALTTHPTARRRTEAARSRFPLYLAGLGLLIGLVVIGVSVLPRGPQHTEIVPTAAAAGMPVPVDDDAGVPASVASVADPRELPSSEPNASEAPPPAGANVKPRLRLRPRSGPAKPPEKTGAPRITPTPRY